MASNLFMQLQKADQAAGRGITLENILKWANATVDSIENTERDWSEYGTRISDAASKLSENQHNIAVIVDIRKRALSTPDSINSVSLADPANTQDNDVPTDIVLNLQYFFPYYDQAIRVRSDVKIILALLCATENDHWRVNQYLGVMSKIKPQLAIVSAVLEEGRAANTALFYPVFYHSSVASALFPLYCVGKNSNAGPKLTGSVDEYLSTKDLANMSPLFFNYINDSKSPAAGQPVQLESLIHSGFRTIDAIHDYFCKAISARIEDNQKAITEKKSRKSKLMAEPQTAESKNEIKDLQSSISKTEQTLLNNQMLLKQKENLCREFWNIIHSNQEKSSENSRLKRLPLITQVLWLHSLRHLLEQGELYSEAHGFVHSKITLALWDSIAYGEGILQLLENCELHSQHHCGYLSIYFHRVGLRLISELEDATNRRLHLYYRYRLNKSDSFQQLSESVYMEFNITDMGRDFSGQAFGIEQKSNKPLLTLFEGSGLDDSPENAIHHYGMPLFYRTVMIKSGRFICTTPKGDGTAARLHAVGGKKPNYQKEFKSSQAFTSYQILLPLSARIKDSGKLLGGGDLLDSSFLLGSVTPSDYAVCTVASPKELLPHALPNTVEEKIKAAEHVCNQFKDIVGKQKSQFIVYTLKIMDLGSLDLEIYLKGIFLYIAELAPAQEPFPLLLRLVFRDEYALSEAVRRFSIFYDRAGQNKWIGRTQIAFCNVDPKNSEESVVRLVLAGSNISTAYTTAKQFMHYNIDLNSGFLLSQIDYLSHQFLDAADGGTAQPIFPFDLVRASSSGKKESGSDFERKIYGFLNKDMQTEGYGCKLFDAHIRLGSKIHLRDFYDAELLFQNTLNTYRFAYLLAEQIIQQDKTQNKSCCVIGYENYASLLVEEVKALLEKAGAYQSITHLQYVRDDNMNENIIDVSGASEASIRKAVDENDPEIIIILPIGTTLSTIYKIQNAFSRKFLANAAPKRAQYFALIVVGDDPASDGSQGVNAAGDGERPLSDLFWTLTDQERVIKLKPESCADSAPAPEVHWFFMPTTKWYLPEKCSLCGTKEENVFTDAANIDFPRIPLGQVDKTSTIPALIFPVRFSGIEHGISFSIEDESKNDQRLLMLQNCIEYGHISRGANHYQFYITYEKYYKKVQESCLKWLDEKRRNIDGNAFNIIISPLQYDNSLFIKDVADHLFQHSLHFIYISLHQTFREEMRSRFNFITKEYRDACDGVEPPQYNVYYIDYSLVSGQTLRRAETLIRMLINDVSPDANIHIFEKIVLLTNRSSFDTAATFVKNPKEDFLAFSTLCIPSYNTLSNRCPACETVETYRTIARSSATNELYWHCRSLEQKHELKSLPVHKQKMKALHYGKTKYLISFYHSLLHELDVDIIEPEETGLSVRDCFQTARKEFDSAIAALCPSSNLNDLTGKSKLTLGEVVRKLKEGAAPDSDSSPKAIELYYQALIDGRNWRRLFCAHRAVLLSGRHNLSISDIWQEISSRVFQAETSFEQREWLISYIKAFSREYPAKFTPIRNGIYTLLELLFVELLNQSDMSCSLWKKALGDNYDQSNLNKMLDLLRIGCAAPEDALQLYQLYLTFGKRLCDLQSNLLLHYSVLEKLDTFLLRLRKLSSRAESTDNTGPIWTALLKIPDNDVLQSDYLYMIKWAAMSSSEEAKAFLLQQLTENMSGRAQSGGILLTGKFAEIIKQENTRVLYSGIKRLNEMPSGQNFTPSHEIKFPQETSDSARYFWSFLCDHVRSVINGLNCDDNGGIGEAFKNCSAQNPLYDLCKYLVADLKLQGSEGQAGKKPAEFFEDVDRQVIELLAALLGFYRLIETLEDKEKMESLKDYRKKYSDLCFFLGKIGGYSNCCLVHKSNDEYVILAEHTAGIEPNLSDIVKTILQEQKPRTAGNLYNMEGEYVSEDGSISASILALQIKRADDDTKRQKISVVLFDKKDTNEPIAKEAKISHVHYLLFMRQQLQSALERDLYALHYFKLSRDDVSRVRPKEEEFCILHLTDLHISAKNEKAIIDLIHDQDEELKAGNPELMVITGDIVQGNGSATDLEENYECAKRVLSELAKLLWTQRNQVSGQDSLRVDWRKRIIIIPGNHDYSSMNELVASSTLRATRIGVPSHRNGTPMSKYAYYIQFMHDFLEIDARQSIRDNLNALIEYHEDGMKLRFIALNSVAEVGPLRNNKVQLDGNFINQLPTAPGDDDYLNICLSHHTCCYKPDYFEDRYWQKGIEPAEIELAKKYIQSCKDGLNQLAECKDQKEKQSVKAKTAQNNAELETKNSSAFKKLSEEHTDTELFRDIRYVKEHWSEETNEHCKQIFSDYELNQDMADTDLRIFRDRLTQLYQKFKIAITLGGHRHCAGRTENLGDSPIDVKELDGRLTCVEGGKFYSSSEKTRLNYGKLIISDRENSRKLSYRFYPTDTSLKTLKPIFERTDLL